MAIKLRPLAAGVGVVAVFLFAYFRPIRLPSPPPQRDRPDFLFKSVSIEEYSGDQLTVVLAASEASIDRESGRIEMSKVSGNVLFGDQKLQVNAPAARYHRTNNMLDIDAGQFLIVTDGVPMGLGATQVRWDITRHLLMGRGGIQVRSDHLSAQGPGFDFFIDNGRLKLIGRSKIRINK